MWFSVSSNLNMLNVPLRKLRKKKVYLQLWILSHNRVLQKNTMSGKMGMRSECVCVICKEIFYWWATSKRIYARLHEISLTSCLSSCSSHCLSISISLFCLSKVSSTLSFSHRCLLFVPPAYTKTKTQRDKQGCTASLLFIVDHMSQSPTLK